MVILPQSYKNEKSMELKDFIKGVVSDITNAVKECQDELDNGAIISPTNINTKEGAKTENGRLSVSNIEFEVSVSTSSTNETGGKINVISAIVNGGIGSETRLSDGNVSKIRFSIPLIYPFSQLNTLPRVRVSHP